MKNRDSITGVTPVVNMNYFYTQLAPSFRGLPNFMVGHVAQLHLAPHLLDAQLPLQDGDQKIFHY